MIERARVDLPQQKRTPIGSPLYLLKSVMLLITTINMVDLSEWESGKCSPLLEPGRWTADSAALARPRSRSQVQRHLSSEQQLEVVRAYQVGKTVNAVAREFKLHRTTVTAILDRHDVPVRAHYMTESHLDQARGLYESGQSLAAVGARLGFDAATIANQLRKSGARIRSPHE